MPHCAKLTSTSRAGRPSFNLCVRASLSTWWGCRSSWIDMFTLAKRQSPRRQARPENMDIEDSLWRARNPSLTPCTRCHRHAKLNNPPDPGQHRHDTRPNALVVSMRFVLEPIDNVPGTSPPAPYPNFSPLAVAVDRRLEVLRRSTRRRATP